MVVSPKPLASLKGFDVLIKDLEAQAEETVKRLERMLEVEWRLVAFKNCPKEYTCLDTNQKEVVRTYALSNRISIRQAVKLLCLAEKI